MPCKKIRIFLQGFCFFSFFAEKENAMRTPFLLLTLLALLAGCDPLGNGIEGDRPRNDCGPHGPGQGGTPGRQDPPAVPARPDTSILFSAVRYPDDYDWQRDTAYGSVPFELLLFRDFEPVLTLASGPDACFVPDPDRHHLLSGHLYTERMADGMTRVGRDGQELFRFNGREYLVGLLEDGDDLYTLSRPARGRGWSYRKNGEILLNRTDGAPYGDLSDPSYGPTGALYRDDGQICFCYIAGAAPNWSFCLARDGMETRMDNVLPSAGVLDMKLRGGKAYILKNTFLKNVMSEGRIWPEGSGYAVTGRFSDGTGGYFSGYLDAGSWTTQHRICGEEAVLYRSAAGTFAVHAGKDGTIRWYGPEGGGQADLPCLFPTPACAVFPDGRPLIALSPRDSRRRPFILDGSRLREVDVHGCISSLAVEINLPN